MADQRQLRVGGVIGHWTIERLVPGEDYPARALVRCACGMRDLVPCKRLSSGQAHCSSCARRAAAEKRRRGRPSLAIEPGTRFGKWTVLGEGRLMSNGACTRRSLRCRCDCGGVHDVMLCSMRNLVSKQCAQCRNNEQGERWRRSRASAIAQVMDAPPAPIETLAHVLKPHFVAGIASDERRHQGYLTSELCDTYEAAVERLAAVGELTGLERAQLKRDGFVRLRQRGAFLEISQCSCATPDAHVQPALSEEAAQ